jgi:hypothetical protein
MVANVGPADWNYDETLSTLRYANRCGASMSSNNSRTESHLCHSTPARLQHNVQIALYTRTDACIVACGICRHTVDLHACLCCVISC